MLERTDRFRGGLALRFQYEIFWKPTRVPGAFLADWCIGLAACLGASFLGTIVLHAAGLEAGSGAGHDILEAFHERPWVMTLFAVLLVPPIEEFLFRVVPRIVVSYWRPLKQAHWALGVAVALLFAFLHISPDSSSIPLPQFCAGLVFWYMQWRHGFFGAVAMHASYNAALSGLMAVIG